MSRPFLFLNRLPRWALFTTALLFAFASGYLVRAYKVRDPYAGIATLAEPISLLPGRFSFHPVAHEGIFSGTGFAFVVFDTATSRVEIVTRDKDGTRVRPLLGGLNAWGDREDISSTP